MTKGGRRVAAGVLILAAVVWVLVNGPVEGPVLFRFSPTHGVTLADLASVAAVLLALALLVSKRQ